MDARKLRFVEFAMTPRTRFEMWKPALAVCAVVSALAASAAEQTIAVTGAAVEAASGQMLAEDLNIAFPLSHWVADLGASPLVHPASMYLDS